MTGVTLMAAELNSKRLEILRDIVPGLQRVAIIANPEHHGVNLERATCEETGQRLGIDIRYYRDSPRRGRSTAAFAAIKADPPQAISVFSDGFAVQNRQAIFDFAKRAAHSRDRGMVDLRQKRRDLLLRTACNPNNTGGLPATSTASPRAPSRPNCRSSSRPSSRRSST